MLDYKNCPVIYRDGWKVCLIPWGYTEKEFQAIYEGWKKEHCFKDFDNPATIDFLSNPDWAHEPQE